MQRNPESSGGQALPGWRLNVQNTSFPHFLIDHECVKVVRGMLQECAVSV